jgi:hypothetical protein
VSDWVLVTSEPLAVMVRAIMMVLIGVNAGLLWRLYLSHRVGRMPITAAVGETLFLAGLLWSQARRLNDPEVFPSTALFLAGLVVSMAALLGTMKIGLFQRWTPDSENQ